MASQRSNSLLKIDFSGVSQLKYKYTKIIATIGPKTSTVDMLNKLMDEGMNVARLNLSHANPEFCQTVISNLVEVLKGRGGRRCAVLMDLPGPEIRTGPMEKKTTTYTSGKEITIHNHVNIKGNENELGINFPSLTQTVQVGSVILIADGALQLTVSSIKNPNSVICTVNNTASITEHKTVYIVGVDTFKQEFLTEKDREYILFGIKHGVDLFACSVNSAEQLHELRSFVSKQGDVKLIAKIESMEGVNNFDEILEAADGIMIARGILGMHLPLEQIFVAQKSMISKCNAAAKPVITAKQMLESMNVYPRPTRAEATDVCNAVLDGTDSVMLSNETALGEYPIEAIRYMRLMCKEAERVEANYDYTQNFETLRTAMLNNPNPSIPEVVTAYAVRVAIDIKADIMIVITESGTTARQLCKFRPQIPVFCITNSLATANYLLLTRATIPHIVEDIYGSDVLLRQAMERAKNLKLCHPGSLAVCVSGVVEGASGQTNMVRVLTVK